LRERREDIAPMFAHFLNQYAKRQPPDVSVEFMESLCLYSWPRNVRELERLARQLLALHGEATLLRREVLPTVIRGEQNLSEPVPASRSSTERREHDFQLLVAALKRTKGNVKAAAATLGFSRQRAYRLMSGRSASELPSSETAQVDSNGSSEQSLPSEEALGGLG
jgi:DNA-binding NtrC family response regulator